MKLKPYTMFEDPRASDKLRKALRELLEKGYFELFTDENGKEVMRLTDKARNYKPGDKL